MADPTIPTSAFSPDEAEQFVLDTGIDVSALPPWGRVWVYDTRQILVWVDASGRLQVIDITSHPIGDKVNQAPFHTADESFLHNLLEELENLPKNLPSGSELAGLVALGLVAGIAVLVAK